MKHNCPQPMTDAEFEEIVSAIEMALATGIRSLEIAEMLFHTDTATLYPDESIATAQCREDLEEIVKSIQRRRVTDELYQPSERVLELIEQFQSK